MKNEKLKKYTIIFFISLILFSAVNPVFAAINTDYNVNNPVQDDDLDTKVKDSVIIDALSTFVYSIASMVENLVGKAFQGLTGQNSFPWADRVLFNAVPMLDVNIFNPSSASLFKDKSGDFTPLAKMVRDTYFTVMTIAVAFLTIVVGIAAVKLAITSLASEKAKYKEAITKWMLSIVLLFLMHNLISFIFWTNEQMVKVASTLITSRLEQANIDLLNETINIDNEKALENFFTANEGTIVDFIKGKGVSQESIDVINDNKEITYKLLKNGQYFESILFDAHGDASHGFRNKFADIFTSNGPESISALSRDVALIKDGRISGKRFLIGKYDFTIEDLKKEMGLSYEVIKDRDWSVYNYYRQIQILDTYSWGSEQKAFAMYQKYGNAILSVYNSIHYDENNTDSNSDLKNPDLIATLGQYFKESAYVIPIDEDTGSLSGWHRSKLTVQGALLYAIFVFQSIFYFFSYIKRFFYIVILVIMAPFIVVMDFLRKALV